MLTVERLREVLDYSPETGKQRHVGLFGTAEAAHAAYLAAKRELHPGNTL